MYSNSYLYFVAARVIGMAHRPLLLYYFMHNEMVSSASIISMLYLFLSGLLVLFSIPFHIDFYKVFFSNKVSLLSARDLIQKYISSVFTHITVITPIILIILIYSVDEVYLALLITLLLLVEKIYDEIQRFLLFSKEFVKWSNIFLIKMLVPIILSIVTNYLFSVDFVISYIIFSILIGFVVCIGAMPKYIKRMLKIGVSNIRGNITFYTKQVREKYFSRYIISILNRNIMNVDKWIINSMNISALFIELTFLSQLGNGISIGGNYLYVSNRRSDLINVNNNLSSLWNMGKVLIYTTIMVLGLYLALLLMKFSGLIELDYFSAFLIFILFMSYAIYAVTEPISEYLFWNKDAKLIIAIEIVFYLFMITGGYLIYINGSIIYIPILLLISILLRLLMQINLISRARV